MLPLSNWPVFQADHWISLFGFSDAEVVEGLAYHNGENALYWTSFDFRAIMKHDLSSQLRNSSVTVVGGFSNADLLRAIVLYECEK